MIGFALWPLVALASISPLQTSAASASTGTLNYAAMAARIIGALKLREGERVLIRYDPEYFNELIGPLRRQIRARGAIDLGALEYVESSAIRDTTSSGEAKRAALFEAQSRAFAQLLEAVEVYLWLPLRAGWRELPAAESHALQRWLDKGGARRQIHFHWSAGSVLADGLAGEHVAALDSVYQEALDINYAALSTVQDRAIALLRSGTVRVRTPLGTDLSFRTGNRPFNKQNGEASNKQNGEASPERAQAAVVRLDREIELPAGVLRVAPLEETVNGRIVIPTARFGDKVVRQLKLEINRGHVVRLAADENLSVVEAALNAGGEAARRFRELGIGFNPRLHTTSYTALLPYYGYGAGVVRLSLGDNRELGGTVAGDFVRWFFFPDATVEVDGRILVREGKLVDGAR